MLNNFVMPDLYPAAPEIFLLLMSFLVLFVDLVFGATHRWMAAMLTVVTLLAIPFLSEHVGWRRGLAIIVGFAGVLVVLRPGAVPADLRATGVRLRA